MNVYDPFINDDEEIIAKGNLNEEEYQASPDSSEIYEIIKNSDKERAANSYDQCIGAGVVLPDSKSEKLMIKVRKSVRYDDTSTGEGNYNAMHGKSLYKV